MGCEIEASQQKVTSVLQLYRSTSGRWQGPGALSCTPSHWSRTGRTRCSAPGWAGAKGIRQGGWLPSTLQGHNVRYREADTKFAAYALDRDDEQRHITAPMISLW